MDPKKEICFVNIDPRTVSYTSRDKNCSYGSLQRKLTIRMGKH